MEQIEDIHPDTIKDKTYNEEIQLFETFANQNGGTVLKKSFVQSPNFKSGSTGWNIDKNGNAEFNDGTFRGTLSIGGSVITIDNTKSIQDKLDEINTAGGGTLYLKAGTYTLASDITMYANVALIGVSPNATILDFNSTAGNLTIAGTHRYSTGTLTSITNGVTVVGSGTSWSANVVAGRDSMFVNGQWMIIATVTDDTHITLAEGYDGPTVSGDSYRISSTMENVRLSGFNVKNSTGDGIDIDDARYIVVDNVLAQDNNIGLTGSYVAEFAINGFTPVSNTSHGISITNGGRFNWNSTNAVSNGGSGIVLNSIRSGGFSQGVGNSNTADGFNLTSCTDISLVTFDASSNGGQGIELVSGNTSISVIDSGVRNNTSDGLKLTATSDKCLILGGSFENNGGYGINIAASTCDDNIVNTPQYASNSSGTLNDSGTGTVIIPTSVDTNFFAGVGEATTVKTYWNFSIPILVSTNVPSGDFWTLLNYDTSINGSMGAARLSPSSDANCSVLTTKAIFMNFGGTPRDIYFDTTKKIIVEFMVEMVATGVEQAGFGLVQSNAPFFDYDSAAVSAACFTIDGSGNLYGHTSAGAGGAAHTETSISGVTLTDANTFRIEFDPGVDVKFYVNGTLGATNTTNLPTTAHEILFGWGAEGDTSNGGSMMVTAPYFAIEK